MTLPAHLVLIVRLKAKNDFLELEVCLREEQHQSRTKVYIPDFQDRMRLILTDFSPNLVQEPIQNDGACFAFQTDRARARSGRTACASLKHYRETPLY